MIELSTHDKLDDAGTEAVYALVAAALAADRTDPMSEQFLHNLSHPGAPVLHLLAVDPAAGLVGYSQLDMSDPKAGPVGELIVAPAHRRRGVGTALVEAVLRRTGGSLGLWAHAEHPDGVALAQRFGFARARVLWQMSLDLAVPPPAPEFPAGVALRSFVAGRDEAEFLRVNNAAFVWHPEQGGWDTEQIALRVAEPWFDPDGFLLAVDAGLAGDGGQAGRLLGYHWTKVHPAGAAADPIGEVYVLGVDPAAQGRRLGRALTLAGLHYLRRKGLSQVMLYVEAENAAAVRVYRDLGFVVCHTHVVFRR